MLVLATSTRPSPVSERMLQGMHAPHPQSLQARVLEQVLMAALLPPPLCADSSTWLIVDGKPAAGQYGGDGRMVVLSSPTEKNWRELNKGR